MLGLVGGHVVSGRRPCWVWSVAMLDLGDGHVGLGDSHVGSGRPPCWSR